ncbi:MAG TPA: WD40 repeat domain-containing protein [Anaerolineae bacterium]|nr:WD40 repeat domain-containing protein [Anaerolineae bacterium]HQH38073.1 WD40 repeat domain-containing protein [Anaerolineae bacterium]
MKLRIALFLTVLASLLWVLALPVWIVRYALWTPDFYRRWLRESDLVAQGSAALADDLPRQIPEAAWPSWIPRTPESLRAVLDYVLSPAEVEAALVRVGPSWAAWALGETSAPERLTPEVARLLSGERGENIRAFLWRMLPSCATAAPPACVPVDPGAHSEVGQQQQAWWNGFTGDFVAVCDTAETQVIAAWQSPTWLRWVWYAPLLALVCAVVAAALLSDRRRWACISAPLLAAGLIVGGVGGLALLDRFPPPDIRAITGVPFSAGTVMVFVALWRALMHVLGPVWVMGGAAVLALGLTWWVLIFESWRGKGIAVSGMLLALWGGMQFYPGSFLTPLAALPALPLEATPTPWPTFTSTPTLTPTPYYWPVAPGTAAPTPSGPLTADAQRLGCLQGAEAPVLALAVAGDEVHALYAGATWRYRYSTLLALTSTTHPLTFTTFALSQDGTEIAVARARDLYVEAFPAWTRALRSRVSTFSRIQTLTYAVGHEQLVLGLENGYLWVIDPATGAIVWLLQAGDSPVTALAAHPTQPLVLSGTADGAVRLWDMANGAQVAVLEGHSAAVQFLAFAPQGERALSVDAQGRWILWDVAQRTIVRQRTPASIGALSALLWLEDGIIGGTATGELLFVDADLSIRRLPVSAEAITAMTVDASGAAWVGFADGKICVWGVLDLP